MEAILSDGIKLELGGGTKPRGEGFRNVDLDPAADVVHDLRTPLPFPDDSVSEVYSSHCLEHIPDPMVLLREIARVGRVGCAVEIRCPFPISDLAMVWDHAHVFGPMAAINVEKFFPAQHWTGPKRLKLLRMEYHPSELLQEAKRELWFLKALSDEVIMKWIPRTCHETRFFYLVVKNEFCNS